MKIIKLLPLFGVVLFISILWNLSWDAIFMSLYRLDFFLLTIVILLQVPVFVTKGLKWKILTKSYSIDFPLRKAVSAWLVGFAAGIVTPGRVGDLARAYYFRKDVELGKSFTTVIADRIIDVFVLFFLSIIGLLSFLTFFATGMEFSLFMQLFVVLFAGFIAAVYLVSRKGIIEKIARPFYRRFLPKKHKSRAKNVFNDFYKGLRIMRKDKKPVFLSAAICVVSWVIGFFQAYVLTLAMGLDVSLIFIFSIMPVIVLLDALPISFSGVGTRDAVLIFFFSFAAIAAETAVAFSLLILAFNYVLGGSIGFVLLMKNPIKILSD